MIMTMHDPVSLAMLLDLDQHVVKETEAEETPKTVWSDT